MPGTSAEDLGGAPTPTILALANNTSYAGTVLPNEEFAPTAEAYLPSTGKLAVADLYTSNLSLVDPLSGQVTGILPSPQTPCKCGSSLAARTAGVLFDPSNGVIYHFAGLDDLVGENASSGALVANWSLPTPPPVNASQCAGFTGAGLGLAANLPGKEVFVLLTSCSGEPTGGFPLSVDVVNLTTGSVSVLVTFANASTCAVGGCTGAQPIAYDPSSREIFFLAYDPTNSSTDVLGVDATSGALRSSVTLGIQPAIYDIELAYVPAEDAVFATAVTAETVHTYNGSTITSADAVWSLLRLPTDSPAPAVPVFNWTASCGGSPVPFGSYFGCGSALPAYLSAAAPGTPGLYLALNGNLSFGGQPQGMVWSIDLSTPAADRTLSFDGSTGQIDFSSDGGTAFVLDTANAQVFELSTSAWQIYHTVHLGLRVDGATMDPSTGVLYLAAGTQCGEPGSFATQCTPLLLTVDPPYVRVDATRELPGSGAPAGLRFDPATGDLYVYSTCALTASPTCLWKNTTVPGVAALLSVWTKTGDLVTESDLVPSLAPLAVLSQIDTRTGNIVFTGFTGRGTVLFEWNTTSNAPTAAVTGWVGSARCASLLRVLVYDAVDDTLFAGSLPCPVGPDFWEVNATSLAVVTSSNTTLLGSPWFDASTDLLWTGQEWVRGSDGTVVGATPSALAGSYAYDARTGNLYVSSSNGSNGSLAVVDPTTDRVLASEPTDTLTGPPVPTFFFAVFVAPVGGLLVEASGEAVVSLLPPAVPRGEVTFQEQGLASSTPWSVTVNGVPNSSTSTAILWNLTYGTYTFQVTAVSGYSVNLSSGTFRLATSSEVVVLAFQPLASDVFAVVFVETGLPLGSTWSVGLNGTVESSTNTTILFYASNGTPSFSVGAVAGFTGAPEAGHVSVEGHAVSEAIAFAPSSPPSHGGLFGLPDNEGGYVLVVGAIAGVALAVALLSRRARNARRR